MAKKIEEGEVKKECPSCGLGVALDSKICEFCGWDFEEEDEWILQIEKLERELMLEKQKFEPGSVEQKIEATLYTPTPEKIPATKAVDTMPATEQKPPPVERQVRRVAVTPGPQVPEPITTPSARRLRTEKPAAVAETIEIDNTRIRSFRGTSEPTARQEEEEPVPKNVRAVKAVKTSSAKEAVPAAVNPEAKTQKVRIVRKVKK